ncbi:MAG: LysM peptidoglycan-binding domain-containing protein [Bacteroidales bacterium]
MRYLIILTLYCLSAALCKPVMAQNNGNNTNPEISLAEDIEAPFERNLDSLMTIWYIQEAITIDSTFFIAPGEPGYVPLKGDSIYMDRISKMECPFQLTYNDIVRSFIEVYTQRQRTKMEYILGLADYYFPMFEEIFDYYCLPLELKYLSIIESALNPRAVSRAGASGMWQFMLSTGRLYKLEISTFVDERLDPVKSTYAAAAFLKDLYAIYGDWTLAMAAYNCGPGNVNKAIKRAGGKTDYWDIYPFLPKETRGYVPAFIGAMYAFNYHKEHLLQPKYADVPVLADSVMVSREMHLSQISEVLNIPLHRLEELNPQYRRNVVPGLSRPYPVRLPSLLATRFIELEDSIANYKADLYLSHSYKSKTPAGRTAAAGTQAIPAGSSITHVVKKGETLGGIAARYKVSLNNLRAWNGISGSMLSIGQKLLVYGKEASTVAASAKRSTASTGSKSTADSASMAEAGEYINYKVKAGDSLWKIANAYEGVSIQDLMNWNALTSSSKLVAGMLLKIKKI